MHPTEIGGVSTRASSISLLFAKAVIMTLDQTGLLAWLTFIVPFFLSLSIHTVARIWTTCYLRDGNRISQRRFSRNPWSYVDWIGTLLLPLLGVPFGWTKASRVQPYRFRFGMTMTTGRLLIALSGPVSNLVFAVLGALTLTMLTSGFHIPLEHLVLCNVSLAFFHLLPIPPLAGYHMVNSITADRFTVAWGPCRKFSPIALAVFFVIPPRMFDLRLFDWPITATYSLLGTVGNWFGN